MIGVTMKNWLGLAVVLCIVLIVFSPWGVNAQDASAQNLWVEPGTGMEFVHIPGRCFMMGNDTAEPDERPRHEVCLYDFWMGRYEVTQGQWQAVMDSNPSRFKNGDNYPVETVSWNEVNAFVKKLNQTSSHKFRLPTEAEWEYAASCGGKDLPYAGGDDINAVAWYGANSGGGTHEVGTRAPNGFALYDMSGNVWEWCRDIHAWNAYTMTDRTVPLFMGKGFRRVDRGGSWINFKNDLRVTRRDRYNPEDKSSNLGFRLVMDHH